MNHSSVLIISDDTEFARTIAARWQSELHVPEITLATSDVWRPASASGHDLVIIGPVRNGKLASILASVSTSPDTAAVYVADEGRKVAGTGNKPRRLRILRGTVAMAVGYGSPIAQQRASADG